MKSKKFVWIAAAILLAGMISSCEELGVDGIEDVFPLTPGPTPAGNYVEFTGVEADGDGATKTTALTLHFSAVLSGLSKDNITLTPEDEENENIDKVELTGDGPSYTLYVSGIEKTGDVVVSVDMTKKGYTIKGGPQTVTVYGGDGVSRKVVFSGLAADGGTTGTKSLTLTFGTAVNGLTSENITLDSGSTNAAKGNLEGEGKSWTLYVNNINASGDVSVDVTKNGYTFEPQKKTATVLAPATDGGDDTDGGKTTGTGTEVAFTGAQADGGEGYTTTALSLHFNKAITGLNENGITLTSIGDANGSITKGKLEGVGPSYTLPVSGVKVEGFVKVSVEKDGYAVSGNPRTVAVHTAESGNGGGAGGNDDEPGGSDTKTAIPVVFTSLSSNSVDGKTATTFLTLTFDTKVEGLVSKNIYLNEGGTGAVMGNLTGGPISYTLEVSGIEKGGEVSVTVTKTGYAFSPTTQTATVHIGQNSDNNGGSDNPGGSDGPDTPAASTEVTLSSVTAADGESSTATTTGLKITFNTSVSGLTAGNISITNGTGEAVKNGALDGSGKVYTLPVTVTKQGTVRVDVTSPTGHTITPASITGVQVYFKPTPDSAKEDPMASAETDSIHSTEFIYVGGTLYEVHTFKRGFLKGLIFKRKPPKIDVLVVGGGGSGGYRDDGKPSAGGGAGGYVYYPGFDISGINKPLRVTVGDGGEVTGENLTGDGYESTISVWEDSYPDDRFDYIVAHGGKGAGPTTGGASGGGEVVVNASGTVISTGLPGGAAGAAQNTAAVTPGGGGAREVGNNGSDNSGWIVLGGGGFKPNIEGKEVWYAIGGNGASTNSNGSAGAANTGNGGDGDKNGKRLAGGSGVVIVRWPYVAP